MPCALLYNITDSAKLQTLRFILFKLGVSARSIDASELNHPIGALCGLDGFALSAEAPDTGFSDEMLVLCDLPSPALDEVLNTLRARHASIALKAIVTEENAHWSSLRLHEELVREHEAMRVERTRPAPKHRKKRR